MKKLLLSVLAMLASVVYAGAEETVLAKTATCSWESDDCKGIVVDGDITVELGDGTMMIKEWLGAGSNDIKLTFDGSGNVTSITPVTDGVEGDTYKNYPEFGKNIGGYYKIIGYMGSGYCEATYNETGGHVRFYLYLYSSSSKYTIGYYYIEWGDEDPEVEFEPGSYLYSETAEVCEDTDWAPVFDALISPAEPSVKIDAYANYIYVYQWLGEGSCDLKVGFDADENVVAIFTVVNGVEERIHKDGGYYSFDTGSTEWPSVDIDTMAYAGVDSEGGYLIMGGYFNADGENSTHGYYNIEWTHVPSSDPVAVFHNRTEQYEDWDEDYAGHIMIDKDITVEVYETHIMLRGWMGVDGYDLKITTDADDAVTAFTAYVNNEVVGETANYYCSTYTGADDYNYAVLSSYDEWGYAYGNAQGGYVLISGYFYASEDEDFEMYYYLPFGNQSSVESVLNDTASGNAEYFNLQGIRIANPANGQIVIKRQGNKVDKLIVR